MENTPIESLIQFLSRLPGLGPRSATRMVLFLLNKKQSHLEPLMDLMRQVDEKVIVCPVCGNLDTQSPCHLCQDTRRQKNVVCVVPQVADIWALERTRIYKGQYFVLGGLLSALDGIGPEDLKISSLVEKINQGGIEEVILALPLTVEGQTTLHYLADILKSTSVKLSTLAHGVPVGGELDYLDEGTIQTAFTARREL
jgi:recombination protein RecR